MLGTSPQKVSEEKIHLFSFCLFCANILETFQLEKTLKITTSNHKPNTVKSVTKSRP